VRTGTDVMKLQCFTQV